MPDTGAVQNGIPRQVRAIQTVRAVSFAWCFVVVVLHAWDRGFAPPVYVGAVLHFLLMPQLLAWRANRARDPRRAELQHLPVDAFLLGAWIPVLEFPGWIALPFLGSPVLNSIVNRGLPGVGFSLAAGFAGLLTGLALHGYIVWTATSPLVTTLCFVGSIAYAAGVGHYVFQQTARLVEARERLRESERRYRLIAEHAGDLVAMVDRDGRWLYASPSCERILSAEALATGRDAFAALHEDDQFRVRGALQVVVRSGESCRLRMRLHAKNGEVRRFEALVHAVHDGAADGGGGGGDGGNGGAGPITGAVIAARDVTELRDREEQLEIAAQAFERMAEAMQITSAAGRIVSVNQAYTRITGYASEEVLGRPESDFRSAMQPQSFYDELYAEVLRTGHWDGTTWCRRRDGTVYREWRSVSGVRDADGRITYYVALFRELESQGGQAASA
jgi:PAS domain S-box-containing protein